MKPKVYCPYCEAELRLGDKFCGNCGKKIEWTESDQKSQDDRRVAVDSEDRAEIPCSTCGTINKRNADHCRSCGSELHPATSERPEAPSVSPRVQKKEQRPTKGDSKPGTLLGLWKPAVAVVVIVIGAVVIDQYVSKENIPTQVTQQQTSVPQQPAGANMAVLPQIEDMERQVKANPSDVGQTLQLANFLSDNRFYDKALTYYQAYLQKKPKDTNARVDMGICYKEVGQYDQAMREMKKALEYEPAHLFATFNLGIVALDEGKMYMDRGEMDRANGLIKESSEWFQKTVALAPTSEVGKRAQQLLSQHSNTQLSPSN